MPTFAVPFSSFASPQAASNLAKALAQPPVNFGPDVAKARVFYGKYNDDRLAEVRRAFAFDVRHESMNGVGVDVVTPRAGIAPRNRDRVLINIHGGAFMWGAGSGAIVEAAPIAVTGRIKVVAVDYRLSPEHNYPAVSQDVTAVYRLLLRSYPARNIGIYGCSAGGMATAQTVAWLQTQNLPRPGAVATMCGSGLPFAGDSMFIDGPLGGGKPLPAATAPTQLAPMPYMAGVSADDPVAYPGTSPRVLARFPPTLLIAGGRDFSASASTTMHRRLVAAGVDAESFVFEGMPHAFFVWPDLPESKEAYAIIASFFDRRLGVAR